MVGVAYDYLHLVDRAIAIQERLAVADVADLTVEVTLKLDNAYRIYFAPPLGVILQISHNVIDHDFVTLSIRYGHELVVEKWECLALLASSLLLQIQYCLSGDYDVAQA